MSDYNNTAFYVLSAAGETYTISIDGTDSYKRYSFSGTGALVGAITIAISGSPVEGSKVIFDWNATFSAGGGAVTLLGTTLNANMYGKAFTAECLYNGTIWEIHILPDWKEDGIVYTAKLKDANVTGPKIATSTVDVANLTTAANKQITVVEVSFETGEQANNAIKMPNAFTLNSIYYEVIKALANTDAGTITPQINGVAVTLSSAITIPLSTAINTTASTNCTAANTGVANDLVTFVAAKTTAGGKVRLTLNWTKTS